METFAISSASARPAWVLAVIVVVLLVVCVLLAWTAYSSRNSRVELGPDGLRLRGDLWGRTIPLDRIRFDAVRLVDLAEERELEPVRRTLGTGLPGYASGWFRLRNGEKALLYLTRRSGVVHVPTAQGYSLLLSLDQPELFLERLLALRSPG